MKLSVLMDNNTYIDRYYIGEPGLSYFIESDDKKILFDTGYSDAFMQNAIKMGIDLLEIDHVVISHGHIDHTWGLEPLSRKFVERKYEGKVNKRPQLVAHPNIFEEKYLDKTPLGMNLSKEFLVNIFTLKLSKDPVWITDKLVFLGEIPHKFKFEVEIPIGVRRVDNMEVDDYLLDDSAFAFVSKDGLVVITGCSHAGICNIVEHAKEVTGINKVSQIIGGFHLLNPKAERMEKTKNYMSELNLKTMYPCHCTDLKSKFELAKIVEVKEVGVGLQIEF